MQEYYFNNLDPTSFQRLVNAVLVARFGDDLRVLPLRGADGGRDAETPILHPEFRYEAQLRFAREGPLGPVPKGRHLFQVKHHHTTDVPIATTRSVVVSDFVDELQRNVLPRSGEDRVNYFFLITNVPSSKDSIDALDHKRKALLARRPSLHADVWWQADLVARLDQLPRLWSAFPDLFAGRIVPFLGQVANDAPEGLPKAFRLALAHQYSRDRSVRFRQIDLNNSLARLFVDLDVDARFVPASTVAHLMSRWRARDAARQWLLPGLLPRHGRHGPGRPLRPGPDYSQNRGRWCPRPWKISPQAGSLASPARNEE
jgi:hypothetical protein